MEIFTMVLIGFGVFLLFLLLIAGIFLFVVMSGNKKKKHPFILLNRNNPNQWKVYDAKLVVDKKSKNNKNFFIKALDVTLEMRPSQMSIDGVPHRVIIHDNKNEIKYACNEDESFKVLLDKSAEMKIALTPEEKELTLLHYDTYNHKYEEPLDKAKMINVLAILGFAFLFVIGMIAITLIYANTATKVIKVAEENGKVAKDLKSIASTQLLVAEQLNGVVVQLGGKNITRQIT